MTEREKALATFQTRVRDLIAALAQEKADNAELYSLIGQHEAEIARLKEKLQKTEHDYESLKMAKMMTITDGDLQGAKDRVAKLIREVNKCIALLSDEK